MFPLVLLKAVVYYDKERDLICKKHSFTTVSCNMGILGQDCVSSSSLDEPHAHVDVPKDTRAHTCSKLHRAQITSPGREKRPVTICPEFLKADASSCHLWAPDMFLLRC